LAISPPILIRFGCSRARFVGGGYRNPYPYLYPPVPYPQPVRVSKPLTITNGQPARALIDSESLCDFMSSTLVDQLKLNKNELMTPLNVQLAIQGSRSKINYNVVCDFKYQTIKERRSFDIMNISGYDLILGTPFLYQHSVSLGFCKGTLRSPILGMLSHWSRLLSFYCSITPRAPSFFTTLYVVRISIPHLTVPLTPYPGHAVIFILVISTHLSFQPPS
jgi:hypothetical protein